MNFSAERARCRFLAGRRVRIHPSGGPGLQMAKDSQTGETYGVETVA